MMVRPFVLSVPKGRHSCPTCGRLCRIRPGEEPSPHSWGQRTHCIRGHEFNEENTKWRLSKGYMSRHCRACDRLYHRKAYKEMKNERTTATG